MSMKKDGPSAETEESRMETRVIVVTSGKGGVGKTTVTANLAARLAIAWSVTGGTAASDSVPARATGGLIRRHRRLAILGLVNLHRVTVEGRVREQLGGLLEVHDG
ncbi:MAG TPA: P-loop NTPase, partial [Synergistales bacterium]|nr:P-loop NTPase [Synergistales bacterium]